MSKKMEAITREKCYYYRYTKHQFEMRHLNDIRRFYMCPCCHSIYEIEPPKVTVPKTIKAWASDTSADNYTFNYPIINTTMMLHPPCGCCDDDDPVWMIPLDTGVAYAVHKLIRAGYWTVRSCEGHWEPSPDWTGGRNGIDCRDMYITMKLTYEQVEYLNSKLSEFSHNGVSFELVYLDESEIADEYQYILDGFDPDDDNKYQLIANISGPVDFNDREKFERDHQLMVEALNVLVDAI